MTERIHAALDGELPYEVLTEDERARLGALSRSIADTAAAMRSAAAPDLSEAVMRQLGAFPDELPSAQREAQKESGLRQALSWLWQPRSLALTLRPAYAFAGVVLLLAATTLSLGGPDSQPEAAPAVAAAESPSFMVQFRIEAAGASQVELAGSFTDWQPSHVLEQAAPGVWTVMVPLEPGVHDYTFLVDGERWVVDPYAPRVSDSFGGSNSRLFLASAGDAT